MRWSHVELQHLDEARQARGLAFWKVEHEPGQCGGVDDRVLERAFQASTDEPGVERVMAVLDQNRPLSETQERTAGVAKLGRANQHRSVDVMPAMGVGVDRRLAVDKRVEE